VTAPAPAAAVPPAAASPVTAVAPVAQTIAPRGGGIPTEVGLGLVTAGAIILGGGVALRRRSLKRTTVEERGSVSGS
ncbi:MAG: hypothetical protein M3069_13810, partial [Chloroflexota bacterium]|nr:hypothetical protein [Chloroflexota bacterium]